MLSYMTLSAWMEHATGYPTISHLPSLSLSLFYTPPCLRIQQLPSKILIFINASHMQSWQLLKRTNCPSSGTNSPRDPPSLSLPLSLPDFKPRASVGNDDGKVWTAARQAGSNWCSKVSSCLSGYLLVWHIPFIAAVTILFWLSQKHIDEYRKPQISSSLLQAKAMINSLFCRPSLYFHLFRKPLSCHIYFT